MKLGIRTFSIACTLSLAACGSGPISMDAGDGETGEAGEGDGDGDPQGLACVDEDGLIPGVLRLEPSTARAWMIEDGVEIHLPLDGDDVADWMVAAVAGDNIAIARMDGQWDAQDSIVHGFSRSTGERLWTRPIAGLGVQQLFAADDGWVAGTVSPYLPGEQIGFVMSAMEAIALPDHEPLAAPALGHVAAYEIEGEGTRSDVGWIDLADMSWHPVTPAPLDHYYASLGEDRHTLEYLALVDGAPAFVRARPGEAESIALPLGQVAEHSLNVVAATGRWRVVHHRDWDNPEAAVHVRVDVESGAAVLVDPEPPQGWSFFDCYDRRIAIDGDGRVYYELRNDASARVWAYDVESDAWTQIGLDLGLVDDIDVMARSQDVLLVSAMAQFQTYCPTTEWAEPPEDALVGDSAHLVRREPALTMVLPNYTWQALIDQEQRCVATVGENGWEVRPLDGSDAVFEIDPGAGQWMWLD
jgi:hypothetical protein